MFHFYLHFYWLIVINLVIKIRLLFFFFLEYVLLFFNINEDEECEQFLKSSASGCCLAFTSFFANFSLAFLFHGKCCYFTKSNSVGINLLFQKLMWWFISAINVKVFLFFFLFLVSAHQKIEKLDSNWFCYFF